MLFEGATVAILATGRSMSAAVVESVAHLPLIAVNDAFRLAPHAKALVAQDRKWWERNPEAKDFPGAKFSAYPLPWTTQVPVDGCITTGTNSGALALHVAVKEGAKRVLLYGFDMCGDHYFGRHPVGLSNTPPFRFEQFKRQFRRVAGSCRRAGVTVLNCTPGSALHVFPFAEQVAA